MIDTKKYLRQVRDKKTTRQAARGMVNFLALLFDEIQTRKPIESLLELGIAGGGSHRNFASAMDSTDKIYGIDIFNLETKNYLNAGKPYHSMGETLSRVTSEHGNIHFIWDTDVYDPLTPDIVKDTWNVDGFDVIIDDAGTDWPRMRYSLPIWKKSVRDAYITLVPDGNGVDAFWNLSHEDHMENYNELSKAGLVVFNLEHEKVIVAGKEQLYNAHYIGLWLPDWSVAQNTIEKYSDYIVAGKANIKNWSKE